MVLEKQLLDALRRLAEKLNTENLSKVFADADPDTPSSSTYRRVFGSWSQALALVGLKTGKITGRPWNKPILLSNSALEILDGELLGDGSLESSISSKNPCFAHSTANIHYSIFLEQELSKTGIVVSNESMPPRNGGKSQRRIRTQHNQALRQLYVRWYPNGIKIVPEDLVLTRTKCLHWYLGDGYVEGKNAKFSTCGFTWDEVRRLATMMKTIGFRASVDRHSGGYPVLRLLTMDSRMFLDWIGPCPTIGYEHRWNLSGKKV